MALVWIGEVTINYQDKELMQIFSMLDLHSRVEQSNLDRVHDGISYPKQRFDPIKQYRLETKTHRKLKVCAQSGYKHQAVPAMRLQENGLNGLGFLLVRKSMFNARKAV